MSSVITVTLKYNDNSRSYTESFPCADLHPRAEVIKDCEAAVYNKWIEMGHSARDLVWNTKVR